MLKKEVKMENENSKRLAGERRVAVTGMGIWSCLGTDVQQVSASLRAGRSGIGIDPARTGYGYQSPLTGLVETPVLKGLLDRRLRVGLSEESAYAYMAARQAFESAGMDSAWLEAHETGIIMGNDSSAKPVIEVAEIMRLKKDSALIGSGYIFQSMNSTVNMNLSTIFKLRGINFTVSAACASGSHAIGMAYALIKQGMQDVILAGGAQETNYYSMATFDALGAFSQRTGDPAAASRPFDSGRDGLVPGGGAAALVLEDWDHAVARGARILGEISGYGFSSNGSGISQASSEGSVKAMQRALYDAGLQPDRIDYVNAHATSTPQGDASEATALTQLFAPYRTPVSSTKSMTGHECWMAGASEAVYSLIMINDGFIAPNINLQEAAPEARSLNIITTATPATLRHVLSNSFGFGGTNSALVISAPDNLQ